MRPGLVVIAAMLALSACASTPFTPAEIATLPDRQLCAAHGDAVNGADGGGLIFGPRARRIERETRAEIARRHLIPAARWRMIAADRVAIGMGPCAVLAAWGTPKVVRTRDRAAGGHIERWFWHPDQSAVFRSGVVAGVTGAP
ncbi:MAG: hypothetical protein ACREFD_00735 [Stellaceae bacterium]